MCRAHRSWSTLGSCMAMIGAMLVFLPFINLIGGHDELFWNAPTFICIIIGFCLAIIGIKIYVWDYKNRHKNLPGKYDETKEYTFYLVKSGQRTKITDLNQVKDSLTMLNELMDLSPVDIVIEPDIGGVGGISNIYNAKMKMFEIHIINVSEDKSGYWLFYSDTLQVALNEIRRLYPKHKQVNVKDYSYVDESIKENR